MASVVVRHRPPFRGMSAFTVAVRRRSNCEGAMPNSLLEYVAEGSIPVTASILVVRALVRFRASLEIFFARSQAFFHRLVCFGIRLRAAKPRSIPRSAAVKAECTGKPAVRNLCTSCAERPRSVVTNVVLGEIVKPPHADH